MYVVVLYVILTRRAGLHVPQSETTKTKTIGDGFLNYCEGKAWNSDL